jgi:hypothetical protein
MALRIVHQPYSIAPGAKPISGAKFLRPSNLWTHPPSCRRASSRRADYLKGCGSLATWRPGSQPMMTGENAFGCAAESVRRAGRPSRSCPIG